MFGLYQRLLQRRPQQFAVVLQQQECYVQMMFATHTAWHDSAGLLLLSERVHLMGDLLHVSGRSSSKTSLMCLAT